MNTRALVLLFALLVASGEIVGCGSGGSSDGGGAGAGGMDAAVATSDGGGGSAGDAAEGGRPSSCETTAGTWTLGDGNLYMVASSCVISNFCDIMNGIHTTGTVTETELRLVSVGGSPLTFNYTLSGNTLTIIDAFQGMDLPLARISASGLPVACPAP